MRQRGTIFCLALLVFMFSPHSQGQRIPLFFGELNGEFDDERRVEVSHGRSKKEKKKIPFSDIERRRLLARLAPDAAANELQEFIENKLGSHRVPVIIFQRQLEIDFQGGSHSADQWVEGEGRYAERVLQRVYSTGGDEADVERIIARYPFSYHVELISSERTEATPYFLESFDFVVRNQRGEIVYANSRPLTSRDLEAWRVPSGGKDYLEVVLTKAKVEEIRSVLLKARVNLSELSAQFVLRGPYVEARRAKKLDPQLLLPLPEFGPTIRVPGELSIALPNDLLRQVLRMSGHYSGFRYRRDLFVNGCERLLRWGSSVLGQFKIGQSN